MVLPVQAYSSMTCTFPGFFLRRSTRPPFAILTPQGGETLLDAVVNSTLTVSPLAACRRRSCCCCRCRRCRCGCRCRRCRCRRRRHHPTHSKEEAARTLFPTLRRYSDTLVTAPLSLVLVSWFCPRGQPIRYCNYFWRWRLRTVRAAWPRGCAACVPGLPISWERVASSRKHARRRLAAQQGGRGRPRNGKRAGR